MTPASTDERASEPSGTHRLRDPLLNQGTAFATEERARWGLTGLLPPAVETLAQQTLRALEHVRSKTTPMEKYLALRALQDEHKRAFAQAMQPLPDLAAAIESFHPTALIGACSKPGIFTRPVLEAMARGNDRPLVLALSNPTAQAECTARDAYTWTRGRAIFASGSPSEPVNVGGRTHIPAQANNSYEPSYARLAASI